jgi:tetraacyldisaccharide 4'-kinase
VTLKVAKHWYRPEHSFLAFLLLPLSLVFGFIIKVRRALYRLGWKKIFTSSVPVIVVGNITVGGTGKTPLVIWLANYLQTQGYKPGIVSRGYGGTQQREPRLVNSESDTGEVGDEAVLLARATQCAVVVSPDRVAAVKMLLSAGNCNIVISDDGLQHYRMGRHIEIIMVDGMRRFGNQSLLPAGPLREPVSRLAQADFIVTQQNPRAGEYGIELEGSELIAVNDATQTHSLASFNQVQVHAVAAIGHPERFFASLRAAGLEVIPHSFPDHYQYQADDLDFNDELPIIMTEKDAVKCQRFASNRVWYLPVTAQVDETFAQKLLKRIGEIQCV